MNSKLEELIFNKLIFVSVFILVSLFIVDSALANPQSAPLRLPKEPGITDWDDSTIDTATQPESRRGRNPVYAAVGIQRYALEDDGGAGSGNFHFTVPVVHLPGRGLDLHLDLHYNSQIWHKAHNRMIFNPDGDWPALGWSLGFGKLVKNYLFEPDGTRHEPIIISSGPELRSGRPPGDYTKVVARTRDTALIDYTIVYRQAPYSAVKYPYSATVRYPNGTVFQFDARGYDWQSLYPTLITDTNGNQIAITYRDGIGPWLDTITDTLGRRIQFYYEPGQSRLIAIEGTGLQGSRRTLLRLFYQTDTLNYDFGSGLIQQECQGGRCRNPELEVVQMQAIIDPNTKTGYWFGDAYSEYGMLTKVSERRAMHFRSPSLEEQGIFDNAGEVTHERIYNYPLEPRQLTIVPTYDTMTETWAYMDTEPAVTHYTVTQESHPRRIEIKHPDQSRSVQLSYYHPGQFDDGFVYSVSLYDQANNTLAETILTWERGEDDVPRIKRVQDFAKMSTTEYVYGPRHNQVREVREYNRQGTSLLRRTITDYETNPIYEQRHIFNLVKVVEIFEGQSNVPTTRTEYGYDEGGLSIMPDVVISHAALFDPRRAGGIQSCSKWGLVENLSSSGKPPFIYSCVEYTYTQYYDRHNSAYRGNLTSVTRYADPSTRTGAVTEHRSYDITGNLVAVSVDPSEQTVYGYTAATQYAYPESVTRGATDPNSQIKLESSTAYDTNTGLVLSSTDANGMTTQFGYFADTLQLEQITRPTGAVTTYEYDFSALRVTENTDHGGGRQIQYLNGLGLVHMLWREMTDYVFTVTKTKYDVMGRVWLQSPPFDGVSFLEPDTTQWQMFTYDALGRVTHTRQADGSVMRLFYNETERPAAASAEEGLTVRSVAAEGRQRWTRSNELGQLVEVVMPNPSGDGRVFATGSIATHYTYNALGQVIDINQGPQSQVRRFRYDGLGRLTHQYLPEKQPTLTDAGIYGNGAWSDFYTYDSRNNLTSHTDARGVKTVYDYGHDPLGRLQSIHYDLSGVGVTDNPVLAAPSVSYEYMPHGDLTRLFKVTTQGIGVEEYEYNRHALLTSHTFLFTDRPNHPFVVENFLDLLGRTYGIRYPAQYEQSGALRHVVLYNFTIGEQIQSVTVDGVVYASEFAYNAARQVTAVTIGPMNPLQLTETYEYDPLNGLLISQEVMRAGARLLDLDYKYRYSLGEIVAGDGTVTEAFSDVTGQVTQRIDHLDSANHHTYTYDAWGRLHQISAGPADGNWLQEYTYDDYGNRIDVKAFGRRSLVVCEPFVACPEATRPELPAEWRDGLGALTYDTNTNHIMTPGFSYDASGNLTRSLRADGSGQIYQYDAAGRLAQVHDAAGNVLESYTYAGASNHRIITQYGAPSPKRKYYVWNGDRVIAEYDEPDVFTTPTPQWSKSYIYLGIRLLATLEPTPGGAGELVQYHHPDRLSTVLSSNGDSMTVTKQATFAYGVETPNNPSSSNSRRFTTYDRSQSTGLDYAVNRYYDPQQGRFMQVDPLDSETIGDYDPQTLNLYNYVRSDPINLIDPLGLKWKEICYKIPVDSDVGMESATIPADYTVCTVANIYELGDRFPQIPGPFGDNTKPRKEKELDRRERLDSLPPAIQVCKGSLDYENLVLGNPLGPLPLVLSLPGPQLSADNRSPEQVDADRTRTNRILLHQQQYPGTSPEDADRYYGLQRTTAVLRLVSSAGNLLAGRANTSSYFQWTYGNPVPVSMPVRTTPSACR